MISSRIPRAGRHRVPLVLRAITRGVRWRVFKAIERRYHRGTSVPGLKKLDRRRAAG